MTRAITPLTAPLDAVVDVPGSKSVANRALICAALADGRSVLRGLPAGDDTAAMLDCLDTLGVSVTRRAGDPTTAAIDGGVSRLRRGPLTLDTRLAGTTSRFLTALAALGPGPYTVDGAAPLRARPMGPLHQALGQLGVGIVSTDGRLPVTVRRPDEWPSGATTPVHIPGDVSSQYISALMMIAPLLPDGLHLQLTTPLISRPYLGITVAVMEWFGASAVNVSDDEVTVQPGRYTPQQMTIEADASSASYPLAAAAICGGRVEVPGLTTASLQGDAAFVELLGRMGCTVSLDDDSAVVASTATLHGVDVDMADISDLVPTMAVVALFADSPTTISGVGFIRGKESDRLGDLATELTKFGANVAVLDDGLRIEPAPLHGATVATHHDHRLAMALALAGLRVPGVVIEDPQVVTKSWPQYWAMLDGLR